MPVQWQGYALLAILSSRIRRQDTSRLDVLSASVAAQDGVPPQVRIQVYRDLLVLHCLAGEWFDAMLIIERVHRICRRLHLQALLPPELVQICRDQAVRQWRLSAGRRCGVALAVVPPPAELARYILQLRERVVMPKVPHGSEAPVGFPQALAATLLVGPQGRRILHDVLGHLRHGEGVISYRLISAACGVGHVLVAATVDKLVDAGVLWKRAAGRNGMHVGLLNPHLPEALREAEAEQPGSEERPVCAWRHPERMRQTQPPAAPSSMRLRA